MAHQSLGDQKFNSSELKETETTPPVTEDDEYVLDEDQTKNVQNTNNPNEEEFTYEDSDDEVDNTDRENSLTNQNTPVATNEQSILAFISGMPLLLLTFLWKPLQLCSNFLTLSLLERLQSFFESSSIDIFFVRLFLFSNFFFVTLIGLVIISTAMTCRYLFYRSPLLYQMLNLSVMIIYILYGGQTPFVFFSS